MPDVVLPDARGVGVSLYDRSRGKPIVVVFCPAAGRGGADQSMERLTAWCGDEGEDLAHGFVLTDDPSGRVLEAASGSGFRGRVMLDVDGSGAQAFNLSWAALGAAPRIFVLDPNQRLLETFAEGDPERAARRYVEGLRLFSEATRPRDLAPALVIPRVFEPDFCARLIEAFHQRGHEESGIFSLEEGELHHRVDHTMKKRFDHYVRDENLTQAISGRMSRRVLPEIFKAFCYRVTRLEEFKIVCYRASEKGYFRPHRDNLSPQTVHRRFALTLNLNAGEYDGGELRFPEYGENLYGAGVGEAIVFSCSLLHEAMDVTRGERYVFLAFLYGEDGARQRREMERRMASAPEG